MQICVPGGSQHNTLCFSSQKRFLSHRLGGLARLVAEGLPGSQRSHRRDGASWDFNIKSNKTRVHSTSGVYPLTLDRKQMLPTEAGQLDKSNKQALRTSGAKKSPWGQGVQHWAGTLQPKGHMWDNPGTEYAYGGTGP